MPQHHHPLSSADREAMIALRAQLAKVPLTATREAFDQLVELTPPCAGVEYREGRIGGVPGVWCTPPSPAPRRVLLYLHGGAFILGSAHAFRHFAGQLAARAGMAVFVADYRLAPEHAFPAAWEDATTAHAGLADEFGVEHVAIAGDSAGGGLALTLLSAQRKAPCGVLFSPWTDLTLTTPSIDAKALEDPVLTRAALERGRDEYLRGHDARDPRASPALGALEHVPPLQVHVGTAEILLDDAVRLDVPARAEVHVWDGLPHVFPRSIARFAAARDAVDLAGGFLRERASESRREQ